MSVVQEDAKAALGSEEHDMAMPSRWWRVSAVSAISWMLLSLPLLALSSRMLSSLRMSRGSFIDTIWSMDFVMMAVVLIVSPLPIISGIATMAFLFFRSPRSQRMAAICLRLSLLGMTVLVVAGIAAAIEGERMGGDTGPLQVLAAIVIGVILPTLVIIPSIVGLMSLWRLKHMISERE